MQSAPAASQASLMRVVTDSLMRAFTYSGQPLHVWVEGPYGRLGLPLAAYPSLLCVSGGVGATPAARLLQVGLAGCAALCCAALRDAVLRCAWAGQEGLCVGRSGRLRCDVYGLDLGWSGRLSGWLVRVVVFEQLVHASAWTR
jgi:hypothetical protein